MSSKQKGSGALAEWEDRLNDVMGVVFCIIAYVFLNSQKFREELKRDREEKLGDHSKRKKEQKKRKKKEVHQFYIYIYIRMNSQSLEYLTCMWQLYFMLWI